MACRLFGAKALLIIVKEQIHWNFIQNTTHFIYENASENIYKIAAIFSRGYELTMWGFQLLIDILPQFL